MRLADGVQCDLRGVDDAQFPFALHYFTGSKAHNIAMRRRAIARGLSLNEYALSGEKSDVPCKTEAEVFKALGLVEIPPELREDSGEIEAAEAGKLPDLIEFGDLTGTFHCHSDWSDGGATLDEMAEAARGRGDVLPGNRRSFAFCRLRRGSVDRARARAVDGDRRAQPNVRREVPAFQGDGVRHSGRTARSTIRTSCSMGSITWSRASIRISG